MYDEILLSNKFSDNVSSQSESLNDLNKIFDNLTNDIDYFNKYIEDVNRQKKENSIEEKELIEEKQRIEKTKIDFENYVKAKNEEYEKRISQVDEYLNTQKQNLLKAEAEFKANMDSSLNEFELIKKELEIQKEKLNEEKEQFEKYKSIELDRIKHSQEILESEKNQFEKYKEVTNKKLELENKNIEQKCDKFKALLNQFNANFKPIMKEE